MVFNSLVFFFFLPFVLLLHRVAPARARWVVLLAASLFFYAWLGQGTLLAALAGVTCVAYAGGLWMEQAATEGRKRTVFYAALCLCVGILVWLKYLPFFLRNLAWLAGHLGLNPRTVPSVRPLAFIGVSYFVFQALSYLCDVYFDTLKAEGHFGVFALYLAFFPKLLQGPIERGDSLLPQLKANYRFDYDMARRGLLLFAWGFYKKVAVADRLAPFVSHVFADVHGQWGLPYILGAYYYVCQLYCDFSGYTDMALGVGLLFGIKLSPNFDAPLLSASIPEFWRRWHMTLSFCIRDYLFDPLQIAWRAWGSWGVCLAALLSFTILGFWHGAAWGFIVFGLIHGIYITTSLLTKSWRKRRRRALGLDGGWAWNCLQVFFTFNLVCFSFIFFRAASLADAWAMVCRLLQGFGGPDWILDVPSAFYSGQSPADFWTALAALVAVPAVYLASRRIRFFGRNAALRWTAYYALALAIFFGGRFYTPKQFIYFQF